MKTSWFRRDRQEIGEAVVNIVASLAQAQQGRRERDRLRGTQYYCRNLSELNAQAFSEFLMNTTVEDDRLDAGYRVAAGVIDSRKAKIASKQRPKPVVIPRGSRYSQRIRAKKLSKAMLAPLHHRHGRYQTGWDMMEAAFKSADLSDGGVIKVVPNASAARVDLEKHPSWMLYFDDVEATHGNPQSLFHRYPYDRYQLAALFPAHKAAIMDAELFDMGATIDQRQMSLVAVSEAWRLPISQDEPGRHVIAISGPGGGRALVDTEWTWGGFPFVIITPKPNEFGMWGDPTIDTIAQPQDDANELFGALVSNAKANGSGVIDVVEGAYADEDLTSNDTWRIMVRQNPQLPPAEFKIPPPFHPSQLDLAERIKSYCYEMSGVNEMMAQGKKEAGVTSGVAIRTTNDLQGERFLPDARCYETAFVSLGERIIWACKDLDAMLRASGSSLALEIHGDGAIDTIDWADVDMERDQYQLTIEASSSFADKLPARLEYLAEMAQSQFISGEAYKRLTMDGAPDMEALDRRWNAQSRYMDKLIAMFEESTPAKPAELVMPDPLLNIPLAMAAMSEAYIGMLEVSLNPVPAEADDGYDPEHNLELMREWILLCDTVLQRQQQAAPPAVEPGTQQAPPAPQPAAMAPPETPVAN